MESKFISQFLLLSHVAHSFGVDLYCGKTSCYSVLGVNRKATNAHLTQAFNTIKQKYHPDINKDDGAAVSYQLVVTAYDILKNDDTRREYDAMLDNPNRIFYHYYQYFKYRVSPNVNVRGFVVLTIIIISIMQYLHKKYSYSAAVRDAMQKPKNRNQALQKILEERFLDETNRRQKYKKSKEERKREEKRVLRQIVEDSINAKGKYRKAVVLDTVFFQILFAPYYFIFHMRLYVRWIQKLNLFKDEYEDMPTYKKMRKLNLTTKALRPLNNCSDESYFRTESWLNNNEHNHDNDKSSHNDKNNDKNTDTNTDDDHDRDNDNNKNNDKTTDNGNDNDNDNGNDNNDDEDNNNNNNNLATREFNAEYPNKIAKSRKFLKREEHKSMLTEQIF